MKLVNNESTIILFAWCNNSYVLCKVILGIHFIERTPISLIIHLEDYLRIEVASYPRYGLSLLEVLHEVLL